MRGDRRRPRGRPGDLPPAGGDARRAARACRCAWAPPASPTACRTAMPCSPGSPCAASHRSISHRPPREPRGGIRVDLVLRRAALLHLFNVHFGLKIRERAAAGGARSSASTSFTPSSPGPRVVMGDLNEWFPGAVGRALRRELPGRAPAHAPGAAALLRARPDLLGRRAAGRGLQRAPEPAGRVGLGPSAGGRAAARAPSAAASVPLRRRRRAPAAGVGSPRRGGAQSRPARSRAASNRVRAPYSMSSIGVNSSSQ